MEVVKTAAGMRDIVERARAGGRITGLVPTMGFFHEGHLELMRRAAADCDMVVVTLFVNPTQFGVGEDLSDYPRDLERDMRMAESVGVDYLFNPGVEEMYPDGFQTSVEVEEASGVMCGLNRPGHFRGVATVVAKLFNIVPADRAYFGQKDAQQLVVIRRMARDLDFPLEIIAVPTVREPDGLAMSSRNTYLTDEERTQATVLFKALQSARDLVEKGARSASAIEDETKRIVATAPLVDLEYVEICDNIYLRRLDTLSGQVLIALAARVGKARLIDNILVDIE